MNRKLRFLLAGCLMALLGAGLLPRPEAAKGLPQAAVQPKDSPRKADEDLIRKRSAEFVKALEKGDAKAVAAFWTQEGEYISDDGVTLRGRAAIEAAYTKFFAEHAKLKFELRIDSIRFLAKDTAVEEGFARVTKGASEHPSSNRYSVLHVREGGQWQTALIREWPDDGVSLNDLDWLIGSWTAKHGDAEVNTTYEWEGGKNLIRARFSLKDKERTTTGLQMISRDPRSGQVRSWVFDTEGGFGEAMWNWDGKRWVQDAAGVQADGSEVSATNILVFLNQDAFTFQSIDRVKDGEKLANSPPIKVSRVKK